MKTVVKPCSIFIKLTQEQRDIVEQRCLEQGMTLTAYLTRLIQADYLDSQANCLKARKRKLIREMVADKADAKAAHKTTEALIRYLEAKEKEKAVS